MTETREYLALDPGEKVGWARVVIPEGRAWEDCEWDHGILPLREAAIYTAKNAAGFDKIIYETWRLSAEAAKTSVGSDIPSIQFVGMVRLAAWLGKTPVVPQAPIKMSTARKTAPAFLRDIIAREPLRHDDAHNVSALLHLWYFLWKNFVVKGAR